MVEWVVGFKIGFEQMYKKKHPDYHFSESQK